MLGREAPRRFALGERDAGGGQSGGIWGHRRKWLNWYRILFLVLSILLAPFWVLNYENFLVAVGLDRILLGDEGRPGMIFSDFIDFVTRDIVKGFVLGGLVVAFLPLVGRVLHHMFELGYTMFIRIARSRERRLQLADASIKLGARLRTFCADKQARDSENMMRTWVEIVNKRDHSEATKTFDDRMLRPAADMADHRRQMIQSFGHDVDYISYQLTILGYIHKYDADGWDTNLLSAADFAGKIQTAGMRLLDDLGVVIPSAASDSPSPADTARRTPPRSCPD